MPPFAPIKRNTLICALHKLGFTGPQSGGSHQYMIRGQQKNFIPDPHNGDIGKGFLLRILNQAGISKKEWEQLQ